MIFAQYRHWVFLWIPLLLLTFPPLAWAHHDRLTGWVEDTSGHPLHEVSVQVLVSGEFQTLARTITDHQGTFSFSDLPHSDLDLIVSKAGFESVSALVRENERDRDIVFVLVATLPEIATEIAVFGAVPRSASSSSTFRKEEFGKRIIEDTGDVLGVVPGLTVVQHAGGGKANQYLIRGFDADHGTDFAISFAGIPVNMVSHAHGQGYSDVNFLIPETLETIDVYKGPYFAELGNLATAGAAILGLREEFEDSFFKLEGGQFESGRVVLGLSPKVDWTRGFVVLESRYTNGPFVDPQAFKRFNIATRWSFDLSDSQVLSLLGTAYHGQWNQSGQIPLREVKAGRLDRFGSVDPSEGGDSSRYNFSVTHQKLWANQALNSQFYLVHYDLDLFSNFTFFLNDSLRGDGIKQSDNREIIGGHLQHHYHYDLGSVPSLLTVGLDYRQDFADVGLLRQQERQVFNTLVNSRINEQDLGLYIQDEFQLKPTFKVILGLRHDRFRFDVEDRQGGGVQGVQHRQLTGPKVSLVYSPLEDKGPEFYLNYGRGFHSNDARSVVSDPTGVALAAADGYEVGYRQVFAKRLEIGFAYWLLDLEGELVFVGDEGTTELSGPTRRHGPEIETKWKINQYLWFDGEASYTWGHFRGTSDVIARAPRFVATGGFHFTTVKGISGNVQLRHLGSHPLIETNSVQAEGYTVTDFYLQYPFSERWNGILSVQNLFGVEVKEAQTFFESQLAFETEPVGDNHFNPGNPFTLRLGIEFTF